MSAGHPKHLPTATHVAPRDRARAEPPAALVAVFPRSVALTIPKTVAPVGRKWLADAGLEDIEVSGAHLQFSRSGGKVQLRDAGSRNGTWLDAHPLAAKTPATLRVGSVIRVGRTLLVFCQSLAGSLEPAPPLGGMVGPFGLRAVANTIEALRRNPPANVLIEGETGTGKELAAAQIAQALGRAKPYAPINVAGVAAGVFESQLFGHVAGAFSGAREASPGVVLAHDGGAVFLDEIGELPLELQPKLLRLLENREVFPVGGERPRIADILLIAATNRSLEQMAEQGDFRQDLFARLSTARVALPPLRQRVSDIYAIAEAVAPIAGVELEPEAIEVEALERLLLDPWPTNVRGLIAALTQLAAEDPEPGLRLWAVDKVLGPRTAAPGELTADAVQAALDASDGNETQAAKLLGVSRGKLRRFLNKA